MSGRNDPQVRLLGPPTLVVDGERVGFPTRKTEALFFHLAALAGRRVDRRRLSGLLWSDSEPALAAASLRKALSLLTATPATRDLLGRDRNFVWFAGDPARSDLALFNRCLAADTERAYRNALELWRGEPLAALEAGVDLFDDWVLTFRSETVETAHRLLSKRLDTLTTTTDDVTAGLGLCELLVRIEPTDSVANERLVRALAARGDSAAAVRRFRAFARALDELGLAVPPSLARFVEQLARGSARQTEPPEGRPANALPRIAVMGGPGHGIVPDLFSYAHSELMMQLSRFRTLRCFEAGSDGAVGASVDHVSHLRLSDETAHDYRLVLSDQPNGRAIYLSCFNARLGQVLSSSRIGYEELADRQRAEWRIASAVNRIEEDILSDEPMGDTVFGRWVEAFRLMCQWTRRSEREALAIFHDLAEDRTGRRIGRVHASIGSILLMERLLVPLDGPADRDHLEKAGTWIERALAVDRLEPFSHVVQGWLRVQRGEFDKGLAAFDAALEINGYSSATLIAAAEANAFCGEIDRANALARLALDCYGETVPTHVHGYLANITYLSGDLKASLRHLSRSPDNIHSTLLSIAVHQERGDKKAATEARVRFDQEMRRAQPEVVLDGPGLSRWIESATMIRGEPQRKRLFGALERAGVMVSRPARPRTAGLS